MSKWLSDYGIISFEGSHPRTPCCLLLPAVQLVVGISSPSWTSFPFFICSCIGLVDWSLTSNFLGLFRYVIRISPSQISSYSFSDYYPYYLLLNLLITLNHPFQGGGGFFCLMQVLTFSCCIATNFQLSFPNFL